MIATVDLKAEAAAEVRRLTAARQLRRGGDDRALARLEGGAAWIAIDRRARLRRALGSHLCLIWRATIEDGSGRVIESRLVPVLVDVASLLRRRREIRSLLAAGEGGVRDRVEESCREWSRLAMQARSDFTAARLSREREVGLQRPAAHEESQPGLFDRRVERARAAAAAAAAEYQQTATDRLRAIGVTGPVTAPPARLLLILVP